MVKGRSFSKFAVDKSCISPIALGWDHKATKSSARCDVVARWEGSVHAEQCFNKHHHPP